MRVRGLEGCVRNKFLTPETKTAGFEDGEEGRVKPEEEARGAREDAERGARGEEGRETVERGVRGEDG